MAVILLLVGLVYADRRGWLLVRHNDDMAAYHGVKTSVLRVIDGDTIDIDIPDALNKKPATRIRLWGVNCPEVAHAGHEAQPWADEAAAFTQSHIESKKVILWLEPHQTRDSFGTVIAHIELPDGSKLNEELIEAGFAKADDRWPHAMLVRYAQLELNAKRKRAGIWSGRSLEH